MKWNKDEDKKTRIIITYIVLFTLLLGAILLSLYIGSVSIAPRQVFSVLTGHGTDAKAMQIILSIRLPRVLAAAILGGALAVSGFLLQTFLEIRLQVRLCSESLPGRSWLLHLR